MIRPDLRVVIGDLEIGPKNVLFEVFEGLGQAAEDVIDETGKVLEQGRKDLEKAGEDLGKGAKKVERFIRNLVP